MESKSTLFSPPAAALMLFLLVAGCLAVLFHQQAYDDAYITFRYARNLSQGLGFCYNPGIATMGTTTPLFTFILALIGWAGAPVPMAGSLLSILALFGLATVFFVNHQSDSRPMAGLALGLMVLINWRLVKTIGGEPILLCFLVAAACHLSEVRRCPGAAALLLVLAAMTRGEGLLAAPILLVMVMIRKRRIPWGACLVYTVGLGSWLAWSRLVLGGFAPSTLAAKVAQADSGLFHTFWQQFWIWAGRSSSINPLWYPLLLLIIPGACRLWTGRNSAPVRAWLAFLAWVTLYLAGYSALGVAGYHWYSTPAVVGLLVLISAGLPALAHRRTLSILSLLLVLLFLAGEGRAIWRQYRTIEFRQPLYQLAAQRLNAMADPQSTVSHVEIGYLGYHFQGRTLDLLGLTGEIELDQVAKGNLLWGLMKMAPDYLLLMGNFGFMTNFPDQEPWFPRVYREVDRLADPRFPGKVIRVYTRRPDSAMPPPLAIDVIQPAGERLLRPADTQSGIGQTFHCSVDGLTRIDLMLGPEDVFPEPDGALFQLFSGGPDGEELLRIDLPPGRLHGRRRHYPVRFGVELSSAGQDYHFRITRAGGPGPLPALRASDSGELAFRTWYADRESSPHFSQSR